MNRYLCLFLLLFCSSDRKMSCGDEFAVTIQEERIEQVDKLTSLMRREMLTTENRRVMSIPAGFYIAQDVPVFDFHRISGLHGVKMCRQALVPLLKDADGSVREQACVATGKWRRANDVGQNLLRELLASEDDKVATVVFRLARDGGVESSVIAQSAFKNGADTARRCAAVESLGHYAMLGDQPALTALRQLISDDDSEVAAAAISAIEHLGIRGLPTEPELRTALDDQREHRVAISDHFMRSEPNLTLAISALKPIRREF